VDGGVDHRLEQRRHGFGAARHDAEVEQPGESGMGGGEALLRDRD